MSARGASPYVNDIRSSQLRGLPAGTISTLPRIFRHTSFPGYLSFRCIAGGQIPSAQRNHLRALLCLLGQGQMADRSAIEHFTKRRGMSAEALTMGPFVAAFC